MNAPALRHCEACGNQGLIRVNYHSGEPFDLAICQCQTGECWRHRGEDAIRLAMRLTVDHQVAWVEDFEGEIFTAALPAIDAFVEAGKTAKRAKL